MLRLILKVLVAGVLIAILYLLLTLRPVPAQVTYGVSFSTLQAEHLGLDWREVYSALLNDLKARNLRIPAYWQRTESSRDAYDWRELDFQLEMAETRGARVVLAVGRRLPRWPECHIPQWAQDLSWEGQKIELREYITAVVQRYKGNSAIQYWQVENEPYLKAFAFDHCGPLDEEFLKEEIALVHSLDARPVLLTDSGNLGKWVGPYKNGDSFGTSLYLYFWNPELGQFKTKLPALIYRLKERSMEIFFGPKKTFLIELSLEPWLVEPTQDASLESQLSRMDIDKFHEVIEYARKTSFDTQYLWGVEWWYYLKEKHQHPEFWDAAKMIYAQNAKK